MPIAKLRALKRNPQYQTEAQMLALRRSIARDGMLAPILVRPIGNGLFEVVSGNHRVIAAREEGLTHVPAVVAKLTDEAAKRIAINLNTIHGDPLPEQIAPFLAEMEDATLADVHLDPAIREAILRFDEELRERLAALQAPASLDTASPHVTHRSVRVSDMRETPHSIPTVEPLRSTEYARFKRVLDAARHPTFVGRETYARCAREGGAFALRLDDQDAGVALVKTRHGTLMALSVARSWQGRGVGLFAVRYLAPNWVRAVESAVPFFERLGYLCVGEPKVGRRLVTRVMVRADLLPLAGRLARVLGRPEAETTGAAARAAGPRLVEHPRERAAPPGGVARLHDPDHADGPDDRPAGQVRQHDAEAGRELEPVAVEPETGVDQQPLAQQSRGRPP